MYYLYYSYNTIKRCPRARHWFSSHSRLEKLPFGPWICSLTCLRGNTWSGSILLTVFFPNVSWLSFSSKFLYITRKTFWGNSTIYDSVYLEKAAHTLIIVWRTRTGKHDAYSELLAKCNQTLEFKVLHNTTSYCW